MRLLIDAQLPLLLNAILNELGYESLHVDSLINGDESSDNEITNYAEAHQLTLIELFKTVNFVEINSNGIATHE